ncbi:MAG: RNA 2',3'-cyclic phosphodiesterase [Candidatus Heimdallarchaeota archaeon]|nr:RNA 2',3'-cyclic phosphodiesterase [Candidatus Heimdallarchaeota archaeon]
MTIRSFFAVDIDDKTITRELTKIQNDLNVPNSRLTFVTPENFHFTLKFLGNIEEAIVPELQSRAEQVQFSPFEIEIEGLGCLPGFHYINVVYADVTKGVANLELLSKKMEEVCVGMDVKPRRRAFKSHLTVARVKRIQNRNLLVEKIKQHVTKRFGAMTVRSFKLKKSVRTPDGPIYTNLFEVKATK